MPRRGSGNASPCRVRGLSPADHWPGLVKHFPEGGLGTGLAIEEQRIEGNAHHKVPRKRLADQEPTWLSSSFADSKAVRERPGG